jgi:hypothetical protein
MVESNQKAVVMMMRPNRWATRDGALRSAVGVRPLDVNLLGL